MGRQKDGNHPALQVRLHILRQGKHEALSCWYLEMWHQKLLHHCRRRCLDLLNHGCCLSSVSHQKIERNEGLVKMFFIFIQCVRVNKKEFGLEPLACSIVHWALDNKKQDASNVCAHSWANPQRTQILRFLKDHPMVASASLVQVLTKGL